MVEDIVRQKIDALISRARTITGLSTSGMARDNAHVAQCQGWVAEAANLVEFAIDQESNAYRRAVSRLSQGGSALQAVASIASVLEGLRDDIQSGLLGNMGNLVRAETFDNFLEHADFYVVQGMKNEAGIIAGVVFEDTVRRIARDQQIDEPDRPIDAVINALAARGVITGQQGKQARVGAHVRAKATHALWDEFDMQGVEATVVLCRTLLRNISAASQRLARDRPGAYSSSGSRQAFSSLNLSPAMRF